MFGMSRREFLLGSAGTAAALAGGGLIGLEANAADMTMPVSALDHAIMPNTVTKGMMTFGKGGPPPVLRLRQGQPFSIDVVNTLDEATIVHWHGLRIPNQMDGVPYLTQNPIEVGERFRYTFTPPDAGTF